MSKTFTPSTTRHPDKAAHKKTKYTVFKKHREQRASWFEGVEGATPVVLLDNPAGRATLLFVDEFPLVELPHICPRTGVTAESAAQADELFGWRKVGELDTGEPHYIVQSWCRQARSDAVKQRRQEKATI